MADGRAKEAVEQLGADQIAGLILNLPYWRSDRVFTDKEWGQILKVAEIFQAAPDEIRKTAIQKFYEQSRKVKYDGIGDEFSKAYILFRIAFEVLDSDKAYSGPWVGPRERSALWPICISKEGVLSLSDLYKGSATRYLPETDYLITVARYGKRDLRKLGVGKK